MINEAKFYQYLKNNIPEEDIQVISLPVDLVAKKNLDPSDVVAVSRN